MYSTGSVDSEFTSTPDVKPHTPKATSTATKQHVKAVLQLHQQHLEMQNEPRAYGLAIGEDSLQAISPWLDRTMWCKPYKNVRRDIL